MNRFIQVASLLSLVLLLSAAPAKEENIFERLFDWFAWFFTGEEWEENAEKLSAAEVERLLATPLGKLLSEVPDADTLVLGSEWPYPSVDIEADLERRARLLEESAVLQLSSLPLSPDTALRVIYRSDQRPFRFLDMLRRFCSVQEVVYDPLLITALPIAPQLPTVVVADDPPGASPFNNDWYQPLFELEADFTLVHFGEMGQLNPVPADWGLVHCPLRSKESEAIMAQVLFGAEEIAGLELNVVRPGFREPELFGIDRQALEDADYTINRAIRYRATPGAQLLVMKEGQIVYERAYGHHTYSRRQPVDPADLYDLASITKAAATTLAVMKLYDDGQIDLKARVRDYLPEFAEHQVGRYRIDQLLTHQTGLQADLPLFDYLGRRYVSDSLRDDFILPLSDNRWLDATVPGRIRRDLGQVDFTRRAIYRYSDINYVLLQFIVEEISEQPLDELVRAHFYEPMGLGKLAFRPAAYFPRQRLVPTIEDEWMRGGLVRGYVHDEGAALLGGVAGHAGLFANAHDLGRLFQLINDRGRYGDRQLISAETIALFTQRGPYNYRALGFDRLLAGWPRVIKAGASEFTIGHTGFSGTCVWADPENDLVYVLLTNRIFPDAKNGKLLRMGTRGRVHRTIYEALESYKEEPA